MKQKIMDWMEEFVEKPNPMLNNWPPCPYARKARINGMVEILSGTNVLDDGQFSIPILEQRDVVVYYYYNNYEKEQFLEDTVRLNEHLLPLGFVALEDHPDNEEYVNGVKMNFGLCPLLFVQKLDKLNEASEQLFEQGYYNTWSQDNIDDVVTWRKKAD